MEQPPQNQRENITEENIETMRKQMGALIWNGDYEHALPLADEIFEYYKNTGEIDSVLIQRASVYYSAASRVWKEKGTKGLIEVGKYMNTALRSLQERIETEIEKEGGKKEGMIPVSLDGFGAGELDVTQAVYRRAAELADKVPLIKPLRQLLLAKEQDPIREFDAAALLAIRAGLKKVRQENTSPYTEIFLLSGAFDIAKKYHWEEIATTRAEKIFELAETFLWPSEEGFGEETPNKLSEYGQAARVARHLRDVARQVHDDIKADIFGRKAELYAAYVPDQKAKL